MICRFLSDYAKESEFPVCSNKSITLQCFPETVFILILSEYDYCCGIPGAKSETIFKKSVENLK